MRQTYEVNRLVLMGGGGHAKSVLDAALRMKLYEEIVITDCNIPVETRIMGCQVVGNDEMLPELFEKKFTKAFITVGSIKDTSLRYRLYNRAEKIGFIFPNIVDPSAVVSEYARLAEGIFVGKNALVNADADIGKMAVINSGSIIEHECLIGKFTHISVGAVICGNVKIGDNVFIGANATVIQGVKIGMNSIIGAGSIVLKDVPENTTVIGVCGGGYLLIIYFILIIMLRILLWKGDV